MSKYKEFKCLADVIYCGDWLDQGGKGIHLIEIGAVEDLQKNLKDLRNSISNANRGQEKLIEENKDLQAKLDVAVEALERISVEKQHRIECPNLPEIAWQALAKLKNEKD